jgi:signal transduction histidine kinase
MLRATARSVASAVDVSIAFMGARRRQRSDVVIDYLRQVLASSHVSGIGLFSQERPVVHVGEGIHPQHVPGDLEEVWTRDYLLVGQKLRSPVACEIVDAAVLPSGRERPPPDPSLAGPTRFLLVVAVGTLPVRNELELARRHASVFGGIGVLLSLAVFFWRVNRTKASSLRTELLLAEERLHLLRDRAHAAAGLAHETRNPLGVIRSLAQMCGESEVTAGELREHAARIAEEVDRTVSRINEFLDYARPREPRLRVIALEPLLGQLREMTLVGADGDLTCTVTCEAISIKADPELLRQALFNLLTNAVNAVRDRPGAGSIEVSARADRESRCEIRVRDDGCGIPEEDLERIFTPYFSRREGGTGLGLAIVKDVTDAHGWTIAVTSTVGAGTEFVVTGIELG